MHSSRSAGHPRPERSAATTLSSPALDPSTASAPLLVAAEPGATAALPIHQDPQFRRLWTVGFLGALVRWTEVLAFAVFVLQQTHSAFLVASMTMLRMLPLALLGVPLGALAARISLRRGVLVSQATLFATSLTLLVLSLAGALQVWHLGLASFVNGAVWAGDFPLRRGLIGDIAGPARMARAMAFDAVANNACRLSGPLMAGLLLGLGGTSAVFAVTASLYLPVLAAALGLAERPTARRVSRASVGTILVEGIQAARATPRLAATLWVTMVYNLFAWPVLSMVPVIGQGPLGLGTQAVGVFASMEGVGCLLGALGLSSLVRRSSNGHVYVGGVFLFLVMLPVVGLGGHPLVNGAALLIGGLGQAGFSVMQATLVYVSAPPQRRLEAMGLLTMCIGISPLGFLAVGSLAERIGAPAAAATCALSGLCVMILSRRVWRPCLEDAAE
jgi:MFS family permease